jgi:DNA repair protein RecO (recombination protein O)
MTKTTTHNTTKGIVLKTMPYKENDLLVYVYTREFGKITLKGRGVRKMTSKNASLVMPMTLAEFELIPRRGISTLLRGHVINYYHNIKKTIESEIIADYLLEYYYRYVKENDPKLDDYNFLKETLEVLDRGASYKVVYNVINAHLMKINGLSLMLDHCVFCDSTKVVDFSLDNGGFVCEQHHHGLKQYDIDMLKAIRYLYKVPVAMCDTLHLSDEVVSKVAPIFAYYVEEYAGIRLKSKTFVKQIVD